MHSRSASSAKSHSRSSSLGSISLTAAIASAMAVRPQHQHQQQYASWTGRPRIKGSSESVQMLLLTAASIGLSFCWGTEMTYCAPYLLSLGLSKSRLSLVWIAGPLSGLVMQPIIGTISDKSCSRYGRRRPFMVVGTALVVLCLTILGWTREIVGAFVTEEEKARHWTIVLAIVDIFLLDFVINIAQTTCQAIVVDTLPVSKQQLGSAWASRMSGVGQMLVYAIGALDLDAIFGNFLGDTQLKKVCLICAIAMVLAQGTTCWAVTERVLVAGDKSTRSSSLNLFSIISQIFTTTRNVPDRIQAILWVQFFSWIGWFPFLFYGSTWVGEIYLRNEASGSKDALNDVGRHGSMSFVILSIMTFTCAIVLPWFVRSPDDEEKPTYTARPPRSLQPVLQGVRFGKPSLRTAWAVGNVIFGTSMIFAPLVTSVRFATILISLCGIPRALAGWAPGAFLGVEVNRMSGSLPISTSSKLGGSGSSRRGSNDSMEMDGMLTESSTPRVLHLRHDSNISSSSSPTTTIGGSSSSTGELSGIYLGILNIYTTLPQFVGTGISWVVFSILEPGKSPELAHNADPKEHHSTEGLSGIAVCLFIGALSALVAAWATRRIRTN